MQDGCSTLVFNSPSCSLLEENSLPPYKVFSAVQEIDVEYEAVEIDGEFEAVQKKLSGLQSRRSLSFSKMVFTDEDSAIGCIKTYVYISKLHDYHISKQFVRL